MPVIRFSKVERTEINEQRVFVDNIEIGTVWQQWFRLGGEGWTNSLASSGGHPTRKEAARDLQRRFKVT